MKSYAEGIEDAVKVFTRALFAIKKNDADGGLVYMSMETLIAALDAVQAEKRRLEKEDAAEG